MKLEGKLFDKGGLKSAMGQAERVRRSLEVCIELVEVDPTGRAAFALLAAGVKDNHGAQATMASMLRNAVFDDYRDAAAEFTEQHSGEDLDQIERDLGFDVSGAVALAKRVEFLGHLRVVVDLSRHWIAVGKEDLDNDPELAEVAVIQRTAVNFILDYLEAHHDETTG